MLYPALLPEETLEEREVRLGRGIPEIRQMPPIDFGPQPNWKQPPLSEMSDSAFDALCGNARGSTGN